MTTKTTLRSLSSLVSNALLLLLVWNEVKCSGFLIQTQRSRGTTLPLRMAALAGDNPRQLVAQGMESFRKGDVQGSIDLFDRAEQIDPSLLPFLWQRGLSYYYADRWKDGSRQFRTDVKVNPLDVEEIVWDIACLSRLDPNQMPPPSMMSLPQGKKDRRKIMSTVYSLFRGEANEHELAVAGHEGTLSDQFYALFYLGLYCESRGETGKAAGYMKAAVATPYARDGRDYMTACARVHCSLRGWT